MAELSPTYQAFIQSIGLRAPSGDDPFAQLNAEEAYRFANGIAFGIYPQVSESEFSRIFGMGYNTLNAIQQNIDFAARQYLKRPSSQTGQIIASAIAQLMPVYQKAASLSSEEQRRVGVNLSPKSRVVKTERNTYKIEELATGHSLGEFPDEGSAKLFVLSQSPLD